MPAVFYAILALFTCFAVAGTHGGIEYDGWTQIETQGYLNDPRLINPPGSYHAPVYTIRDCRRCNSFFVDYTPAVVPEYVVVYTPMPCLERLCPIRHGWPHLIA